MDMSGMMGGMDTGSEGPFRPTNEKIAHALWYCIAGAVGILSLSRALEILEGRQRRAAARIASCYPCRPRGPVSQSIATTRAVFRELAYSQPIYFTGRISKFFSPLPMGRWLILICYWILLLCFLWSDTILYPDNPMYAYKWEKVGFRAAWADGLGKKGLEQGVRLVVEVPSGDGVSNVMTSPDVMNEAVHRIEDVGKHKNRIGGKEYGFGVKIHVVVERK